MKHHNLNLSEFFILNIENFIIAYFVIFIVSFFLNIVFAFIRSDSLEEFEQKFLREAFVISILWPIVFSGALMSSIVIIIVKVFLYVIKRGVDSENQKSTK